MQTQGQEGQGLRVTWFPYTLLAVSPLCRAVDEVEKNPNKFLYERLPSRHW